MTTLLEHLRTCALETESGTQNPVDTFSLVSLKKTIARPSFILFEKGDFGLVDPNFSGGDVPIFSFRKSAMTFVSADSFETLPDDTLMPDYEYQVLLAARGLAETDSAPRPYLEDMPPDEWVGTESVEDASQKCRDFIDAYRVSEDIWWGGSVRHSATCIPFATVRYDCSVWPVSSRSDTDALFTPASNRAPAI